MGGDDLDDDFDLEPDFAPVTAAPDDDGEGSEDDDTASPESRKRRRADSDKVGMVFDGATAEWKPAPAPQEQGVSSLTPEEQLAAKRKKRKLERKKRAEKLRTKHEAARVDTSAGDDTFAPLINGFISAAFGEKLTSVEMEDLVLEDDHFVAGPRPDAPAADAAPAGRDSEKESHRGLEGLGDFVNGIMEGSESMLGKPPKETGAPRILIVAQSAIRCVAVIKALGSLRVGKVGKLFGKHKKASEQEFFLKNTPFICAVGTPARIEKLVEAGHLKLGQCIRLVFDATYQDMKKKTLFEQPDIKRDLLALLQRRLVRQARHGKMLFACY